MGTVAATRLEMASQFTLPASGLALARRRRRRGELGMTLDAVEARWGPSEAQAHPAPNHRAVAGASDVARDVAHDAHQVLPLVVGKNCRSRGGRPSVSTV